MKGNIAVFYLFIVVGMATMEAVKAAEDRPEDRPEARPEAPARDPDPGAVLYLSPAAEFRQLFQELEAQAQAAEAQAEALQAEAEASRQAEASRLADWRNTKEYHTYLSQTYFQIADYHKTRHFQAKWQKSPECQKSPEWQILQKLPIHLTAEQKQLELGRLAEHFTKKLYFKKLCFEKLYFAKEDMRSQDVQERGTGSIWIAAGLSSLATFCVAAIGLILLNLKGQRKVGQKEVSLVNNNILGNADTR